MKSKLPFADKKVIQGLLILVALVVIVLSLVGDKGLIELGHLQGEEQRISEEIQALKKEKLEWYGKIASLQKNRTYVETFARERLGFIKKGEFLILPPQTKLPPFKSTGMSSEAPPAQ